jgi:hypothetical protein
MRWVHRFWYFTFSKLKLENGNFATYFSSKTYHVITLGCKTFRVNITYNAVDKKLLLGNVLLVWLLVRCEGIGPMFKK